MQEPVSRGVVNMVDKENAQFPEAVAKQVTKAGIPVTAEEIAPDPVHILEGAGDLIGQAVYSVGKDVETAIKGQESATYDRTTDKTPAQKLRGWVSDRVNRIKGGLQKKAA